jgi:hypothetical protein
MYVGLVLFLLLLNLDKPSAVAHVVRQAIRHLHYFTDFIAMCQGEQQQRLHQFTISLHWFLCHHSASPCRLNSLQFEWELSDQEARWHHLYHQLRRYRLLYGSSEVDCSRSNDDEGDWSAVAW